MEPRVQQALEELRSALAAAGGRRPLFVEFIYPDGTFDRFAVPSVCQTSAEQRIERSLHVPSDIEADILRVLTEADKPLKGTAVASRARRSLTSHFRSTLARLVREGRIRKVPGGGYWLATRTLPDQTHQT